MYLSFLKAASLDVDVEDYLKLKSFYHLSLLFYHTETQLLHSFMMAI